MADLIKTNVRWPEIHLVAGAWYYRIGLSSQQLMWLVFCTLHELMAQLLLMLKIQVVRTFLLQPPYAN